jgi:glycyl-tRNA synthetase beta chain
VPLEEQGKKLSGIVFHEKLGTVADKVERVAKLARWLVEEGIVTGTLSPAGRGQGEGARPTRKSSAGVPPHSNLLPGGEKEQLADQAERAARLAKADLVTGMVGEFPELQGVVGGYIAERQGEPKAVADAIRDHYKPVGQGDEVPTAPVTLAVAVADKIDSLICFFAINERPSGSKDPFALRRAGLGIIAIQIENGLRFGVSRVVAGWNEHFDPGRNGPADLGEQLVAFFADRLKIQQREAGVRHDLIDAVFALGGEDDLVRLLARVNALQAFVETAGGGDLLTAYKRAANILKRENWDLPRVMAGKGEQGIPQTGEEDPLVEVEEPAIAEAVREMAVGSTTPVDAPVEEKALVAALDAAEPKAKSAVEAEDFTAAMAALASLRAPIDAFFDKVTVNDPDKDNRARRLNLLARFRDAVHQVADFSKIEG